jgi:hypothetical protein
MFSRPFHRPWRHFAFRGAIPTANLEVAEIIGNVYCYIADHQTYAASCIAGITGFETQASGEV